MKNPQHSGSIPLALIFIVFSASNCVTQRASHQSRLDEPGITQQRAIALENLITNALNAPPEFAADVLIRLAESDMVSDRKRRIELLVEAFRRASDAQQAYRREYTGGNVDTREGYLSYAFDLKLDALSLQSKAIRILLKLDKQRARTLLEEIPSTFKLKPLNCDDRLVYNLDDFYESVGQVARTAFTAEEVSQGEHLHLLNRYISGINSPSQVKPVARLILNMRLADAQLAILVLPFIEALKNIHSDDRSFSYTVTRDTLANRFGEIVQAIPEEGNLRRDLLAAFRAYLIKQYKGKRCADNVAKASSNPADIHYLNYANQELFSANKIQGEDVEPREVISAAPAHPYWQSAPAKQLLAKIRKLRFGFGNKPLTDAERKTPGWGDELNGFLNDLTTWDIKAEQSEEDYFHQRAALYESLLDLVPGGGAYKLVLASYISFLKGNHLRGESRIEWFWHANHVINKARSAQGSKRSEMLEQFLNSGDAVIILYGSLVELEPLAKKAT